MRLYIGRSIETMSQAGAYEIGTNKSKWSDEYGFKTTCLVSIFETPIEKTEKILNIKLAPGEIRKVKAITIELEE